VTSSRPMRGRGPTTRDRERSHGSPNRAVIGIDEVGLAPLAGPVVACAILMPDGELIDGVRDSKTLSRKQREQLDPIIRESAVAYGIGAASAREVERLNPRAASHIAMLRAVRALEQRYGRRIDFSLVDGAPARELNALIGAHETIVRGDTSVYSIACASIVAKVLRDRLMRQLHKRYPGYGWDSNAGYPAPTHLAALSQLGVTPHHRRTYAPVAEQIAREGGVVS
jgi:ribonuclease HII